MTDRQPSEREVAHERLARFARGERMQEVWSGAYLPDLMRADIALILATEEAGEAQP